MSLRKLIETSDREEDKLCKFIAYGYNQGEPESEADYEMYSAALIDCVSELFVSLIALSEEKNNKTFAKHLNNKHQAFLESENLKIEFCPLRSFIRSKELEDLNRYYRALTPSNDQTSLKILENILENSGRIIRAFDLVPNSETAVNNKIHEVLKFSFPDTCKPEIGSIVKNYKPEFGVRHLKAAIEFKFITKESELKTAIDGIYTDMKGYSGSSDWKRFYAVFYCTEAVTTQAEIEAQFTLNKAEFNWMPIVVFGQGERK